MGKQQASIKPLDYFSGIKSVVVPDDFRQALSESGRDPDAWQADLNARIQKGGETKFDAVSRAFSAFDQLGGTNKYTTILQEAASAKEARRAETDARRAGREERAASPAASAQPTSTAQAQPVEEVSPIQTEEPKRVSATTALLGSTWNSLLNVVEGGVDFLNDNNRLALDLKAKLPWASPRDIADAQLYRQQYLDIKKGIDKGFAKGQVALDEKTKGSPLDVKTGADGSYEIDWAAAGDLNKWMSGIGSGLGSLVSILAPTKKASALMSFTQMYSGNQDDAIEAGLTGTEATLYTTGTTLVQSALELAGEMGIVKALKGDAGKEVIKRVVKDKGAQAISDLTSKGITKEVFNDVVERPFSESLKELADQSTVNILKKQLGNGWSKFKKVAKPEAATEFLQEWTSYGAQRLYNELQSDATTSPGQGEFQTDAYRTAGNSVFGALVGGFLVGTIGQFAPNSKEQHETLGAFINSDIKDQVAKNPNITVEELKANSRVKYLLDVAVQNGQFNDAQGNLDPAKLDAVARKADAIYDTFYEFKDLPNLVPEDRLSMFNITDTRNRMQETRVGLESGIQQVNDLQAQVDAAKAEGNLLAATKLEATKSTVEQQLGEKDPNTGEYRALQEINNQIQTTESIFNQAIPEITNTDPDRKAMGRSFLNSNLFPQQEFTPDSETVLSDGTLVVRDDESTAIRQVNTVPVQPTSDIASQLDKGTYKPIERFAKEYLPIQNYQAYAEAANNIASDNTQRATDAAKSPYDYRQDATDLIGVASAAAATLNTNPSVYDAVSDRVSKAYEFYNEIVAKDSTGTVPAMSEEEFQNTVGFLPSVNGRRIDPFEQTILAKQAELNIPADVATLYTPSNDAIDTILDIEEGNTSVPIKTIEKSIKELTSLRKLWQNKRKSSRREYTLPQIDEVVGAIENDLNTLSNEISYQQAPELRPERVVAPEPVAETQPSAPEQPIAETPVEQTQTEKGNVTIENIKDYAKRIVSGEAVLKRLSPKIESGRAAGGIRNVEASIISSRVEQSEDPAERGIRQKEALRKYAIDEGIFIENPEQSLGELYSRGFESSVFITPDRKFVNKVNDMSLHKFDITTFFDRLAMHNFLFPETAYELVGFTEMNGDFSAVVKQPFIQAAYESDRGDVKNHLQKLGFEKLSGMNAERGLWRRDEILMSDINGKNNVLTDKKGNLFFIDPIFQLNTADQMADGSYVANEITDQDILGEAEPQTQQPITETTDENPVSEGTRRNTRKPRSVKQQYVAEAELARALEPTQNDAAALRDVAGLTEQSAEETQPSEETDESLTELIGELDSLNEQIGSADGQVQEVNRKLDDVLDETAGDIGGSEPDTAQEAAPVRERVSNPTITENLLTQITKAFPNVDVVIPENLAAFMEAAGLPINANVPKGFIRGGQVFLNLQAIQNDPNTPLHEFGHIWALWARQNNPELYNQGIDLIKSSGYLKAIKADKNYRGLSEQQQQEEALARAVGDKGAQFVGTARRANFKTWLNQVFKNIQDYYKSVKAIAGLSPEQMADLAVDEFAANVAEDILSGNEISGISSEQINAIMNPEVATEPEVQTEEEIVAEEEVSPAELDENFAETQVAAAWDQPILFNPKPVSAEVGRNVSFEQAGTPTRGVIEGEEGDSYKIRGTRSGKLYTIPKSEVSDAVLFSFGTPGSGEQLGTQQEHKANAQAELVSANIYGVLAKDLTSVQKKFIDKTAKTYGWKYLGAKEVKGVKTEDNWDRDISKDTDSFFLADGKMWFAPLKGKEGKVGRVAQGIVETEQWLEKLRSTGNAAYKTAIWAVDSSFDRLTNIETLMKAIDGSERLYKQIISDVKRAAAQNRNYAFNILGRQYEDFRRQLGKYSIHKGSSTLESVEKLSVEIIQWNRELGKSVKRRVSLPISVLMNIVASHQSQISMGDAYTLKKAKDSAGNEYEENHSSVVVDSYYDRNPDDVTLFFKNKGGVADIHKGVHFKKDVMMEANAKGDLEVVKDGRQYGLFTQSEIDRIQDYMMTSGPADMREAFQKVKAAFNDAQVRELIRKENDEAINPAQPFVIIPDYSPIQSVSSVNAQDKVNSFSPNLEDAKQLNERTSRPEAIYSEDILDSFDYYKESVGHILGSTRLVHNLKNLQQAMTSDYDGVLKGRIDGILSDTIKNLQSYRQSQFETSRKERALRPLLLLMGKYTGNIFRSNIGISTKQIGTWFSAMGLGYIDNKYMYGNLEIWGAMAKMSFGGSTIDRAAGGSIVEATGQGLKVGNIDTQEADYIRELLGQNITDPAALEEHRKNWATVIQRVVYGQSQYTEAGNLGEIRFTRAGVAKTKQLWNASDVFFEEYGMANIRRLDRAVILGYMVAAKRQVADEVAAGKTKAADADARAAELTTETLYLTNQMNDPTDLTMLQRNPTFANRIIGMYSGQTQKLWNQMAGAAIDYFKYKDTATPEEKKLLQNRLMGSLASNLLVNTMWMATANMGASMLRGWLAGSDDKEDGYYQDKFKWDVARYMTGLAPGWWSQVASFVISDIDNEKWKDELFDVPGSDAIPQAWELTKATYGLTASVFVDKTEKEKDKLLNDFTYNFSKIFGILTGVPKTWVDPVMKRLKETNKPPKGIKEEDIQIEGDAEPIDELMVPEAEEEAPEYLYDN